MKFLHSLIKSISPLKDPKKPLKIGPYGESLAQKYLGKIGYKILDKNWKCKLGELDLIASDKGTLVFIEVKTRLDNKFARKHLFDSIGTRKKRKLKNLTEIYIKKNFFEQKTPPYRIDAIGIIVSVETLEQKYLKHIKGAI
ncbi:MAG TPA: YraN family protein [Oligoflexia bacterium]|mgnify:CR=1 FL=1|nr:YraN family protein [Oligoflexia bacterium]HMP49720.1 YraN family protein [Oligoflexia bacterium]